MHVNEHFGSSCVQSAAYIVYVLFGVGNGVDKMFSQRWQNLAFRSCFVFYFDLKPCSCMSFTARPIVGESLNKKIISRYPGDYTLE